MEIEKEEELIKWLNALDVSKLTAQHEKETRLLSLKYEQEPNSQGASLTDIKLIAFAKVEKHAVVTQEKNQLSAPEKKSKYKIPLICKEEQVRCIDFLTFLKENRIKV